MHLNQRTPRYPIELARKEEQVSPEALRERFSSAAVGDPLRKILNPMMSCGPAVIEHALLTHDFPPNASVGKGFDLVSFYYLWEMWP